MLATAASHPCNACKQHQLYAHQQALMLVGALQQHLCRQCVEQQQRNLQGSPQPSATHR